ncbi:hypothetical protein [Mesobacillus thioparans]|uniref:hypothetical protein n=1 Tax=Mesobacillus thioparans TaxID=370439 RepID=UPI0039EFEBAF
MSELNYEGNIIIVSTKQLSEIMGVSTRRINQLEAEGAFLKVARGKFDLAASFRRYIEYLTEEKKDDELNKTVEEALWTRARRQKAEIELQIMKGELHRSEDVRRVMNNVLGSFRTRILAIPSKLASRLQAQTDLAIIKEILKDAMHEALTELSDYDPHVFYAESKDKLSLQEGEDGDLESELAEKEPPANGRKKTKK